MSYCRWSSDCHQSDVYVYADVSGGWVTNVASRRRHPLKPTIKHPLEYDPEAHLSYWKACNAWIDDESNWEWRDVSCYAGESFYDDSAKECADRLRKLKADGLIVPQVAIDALDEESSCNPDC